MLVRLTHTTRLDYSSEVIEGIMDVRLGPASDAHQRWHRFELSARPNATVNQYSDGFGNTAHLISLRRPHQFVEVTSRGEVETLLEDPFAVPDQPPAPLTLAERAENLTPSMLIPPGPAIAALAEPYRALAADEPFAAVVELMRLVHTEFAYEQKVTNVFTTVTEVLQS